MKLFSQNLSQFKTNRQRGAVVVLVAAAVILIVGLGALTVDVYHLYVVRNELQNAADAGALAGSRNLYNEAGTAVTNFVAIDKAWETATANNALSTSGAIAVDVNDDDTNLKINDIQWGHWSFGRGDADKNFYVQTEHCPSFDPTDPFEFFDLTERDPRLIDDNMCFINAVKVTAHRDTTSAASFFARVFGYEDFALKADAVGYIGFTGTINPGEVDAPIALCEQSILEDGEYNCSFGRMLNSGQSLPNHNTGGWTNFTQPCDTASTDSLRDVLEGCTGNPYQISLGGYIGATGGVVDSIINHASQPNLTTCWKAGRYDTNDDGTKDASIDTDGDGVPDMPWNVTLPVIDCPSNNIDNCSKVLGAVNVNIVWILEDENKIDQDAPYKMMDWVNLDPSGIVRWNSFVDHFGIELLTDINTFESATYENGGFKKKSVYFLPDCTEHELTGVSGGENYGVLAEIPVLVE